MKIKYKIYIIGAISVVLLAILTFLIFNFSYYGYINKDYEDNLEEDFREIDYILANERDNLRKVLEDWAKWDDTYEFINNQNEEYINSNLGGDLLQTLDFKLMAFLNEDGQVVFLKEDNTDENINNLKQNVLSQDQRLKRPSDYYGIGLLLINNKAFFIGKAPITKTNDDSKKNGYLMIVRQLDKDFISYLESIVNVKLKLTNIRDVRYEYKKSSSTLDSDIKVISNNEERVEAYKATENWYGDEDIAISIVLKKNIHMNAKPYFAVFIIGFLTLLIVILKVDYIIIDNQIFKRLSKLINFIEKISTTRDTSLRLEMKGNDELSKLTGEVNNMLTSLENLYADIRDMDYRFKTIMEATNDGYIDFYIKDKKIYISAKWKNFIGYKARDEYELLKEYRKRIHPEDIAILRSIYNDLVNSRIDSCFQEYRIITKDKEWIWVSQRGKVSEWDESGEPTRIISTISDITRRKKYEEEILFLSYSDKTTGLKNRVFMEQQFSNLDLNKESKYIIIMGDVNGLKLANDTFGHREGDRLICEIGRILKQSCDDDDIISRWGGDEFVILIKEKHINYVWDLVNKIKSFCKNSSEEGIKLSIALGYAEKNEENTTTEQVMSLAEKRMYRNKLLENTSARSSTISSLTKTLHEKHSETEEHTMRIKELSLKLGKRLGLTQDKLDELELVAALHDIGKVGIPENILMKPSKLDEAEWEIMKTHTDIGYRIAKSTQQLEHVAYEILCHHERYDGTGYPSELKGEEIPLVSRIINICDSYDVMTNKRVYKKALDGEYAINEIKRCSGTQFDPVIAEEFLKLLEEEKEECLN